MKNNILSMVAGSLSLVFLAGFASEDPQPASTTTTTTTQETVTQPATTTQTTVQQ
jgi:hypothetical protein